MYSNNILNFQDSMTILNACTKKSGNLLNTPHIKWKPRISIKSLITYLWDATIQHSSTNDGLTL